MRLWPKAGDGRAAGIDEAGRGPLAGPVGVAAVILDPDVLPQGLGGSKAISEAKGEALRPIVLGKAAAPCRC